MSFYFSNKRPTGARGTLNVGGSSNIAPHSANLVTAQNKALLRRLGCAGCPLDKADVHSPKMPPTLSKDAAVYILGESPGVSEDEKTGRPFTGPSGKFIRSCIPDDEKCSFDNLINCRPPQNRNPTQQETQCCYPRRVKFIEEAKPRLILGLGAVPLQAIMGTSDMAGMRGRVFAVKFGSHACWYLPTYHPSFILRLARDQQKPLNSMFGNCFKQDVKKAFELAYSLEQPIIDTEADVRANIQCFDGSKESDFHQLCHLLEKAIKAPLKAIDLETKGLHPWATDGAIMTAAISFEGTNFAFALHHPKAGWSALQLKSILALFKSIIEDDTIKVAHNAPYEIRWFIKEFGPECINHAAWQCSQMQAHFLDERKGQRNSDENHASRYQALDFLVKQYFGISYKSLFKLNKKDMSQSDLDETLIYNAADTRYCLKLFLLQDRLLEERGLLDAYLDSVPRQPTVALMQHLGVPVDQVACKKAQNKLKGEIEVLHAQISSMDVVKKFIADRKEFNPFSQPDVLTLFKDYLKRPEVRVLDKSGKNRLSVDKNILDKIDHPLAALIVKIRNRNKMKSTYVDELELGKGSLIFPDGKLHANLNTTFTECISGDSLILTKNGLQRADYLYGKKRFQLWDGNAFHQPSRKVRYKQVNGFEIQLVGGYSIKCSENHPLMTEEGFKKAELLRVGQDRIMIQVGNPALWGHATIPAIQTKQILHPNANRAILPISLTRELCEFIGMWLADGSLRSIKNERYSVRLSNSDPEVLIRFKELGEKCFGLTASILTEEASINSVNLVEWLIKLGLPFNGGLGTASVKEIPPTFLSAKSSMIRALLRGLTLDSHFQSQGVVFGTQSPEMQKQIQQCLLLLGIPSLRYDGCEVLSLLVTRKYLPRFMAQIGFVQSKKLHKAADILNELMQWHEPLIPNQFHPVEINSIKPWVGDVYDFSMPHEAKPQYIANGMLVHNTGRTSSDEPNMQNYPKRSDEWLRAQIVPPSGHLLVAIDYGQLEACTGAMCSHDSYLVKALWEDYDIHAEWARRAALKCPELIGGKANLENKGVMKKFRSLIKNKMVFPSFFGASNSSVRGYLHNATGYDVEQRIVDKLMDDFWKGFSGVASWQDKIMKRYYNVGYVESLGGRRHHYPLTRNQAVNMPIQCTAAELVCDAMNRLSELALRTGRWYLHPHLNIHDDLSLFIPNDDKIFNEAIEIIAREMLVFDYPWVNVPLAIEISVGSNWANVQPLMKLWSHKEFGFPKK